MSTIWLMVLRVSLRHLPPISGHYQWIVAFGGSFWSKSFFLLAKEGWSTPISNIFLSTKGAFLWSKRWVGFSAGLGGSQGPHTWLVVLSCRHLAGSWRVMAKGSSEQSSLLSHVVLLLPSLNSFSVWKHFKSNLNQFTQWQSQPPFQCFSFFLISGAFWLIKVILTSLCILDQYWHIAGKPRNPFQGRWMDSSWAFAVFPGSYSNALVWGPFEKFCYQILLITV